MGGAARPASQRLRGDGAWWRRAAVLAVGTGAAPRCWRARATDALRAAPFRAAAVYGVAANAVAVPLTSVLVMPAGMLAALLMPLGLEAPALAAMGWGCEAMLAVAREVASWPGAAPARAPIPAWGLACCRLRDAVAVPVAAALALAAACR